jgi:hypothetical protein
MRNSCAQAVQTTWLGGGRAHYLCAGLRAAHATYAHNHQVYHRTEHMQTGLLSTRASRYFSLVQACLSTLSTSLITTTTIYMYNYFS